MNKMIETIKDVNSKFVCLYKRKCIRISALTIIKEIKATDIRT